MSATDWSPEKRRCRAISDALGIEDESTTNQVEAIAALDAAEKAMPSASYDTATRDGRAWNLCLSTVSERLAKLKEQA